jgi:hypothetical protein
MGSGLHYIMPACCGADVSIRRQRCRSAGLVTLAAAGRVKADLAARQAQAAMLATAPFRHGAEAVQTRGRGRAARVGWNEEIPDGREDTDEPLPVPG